MVFISDGNSEHGYGWNVIRTVFKTFVKIDESHKFVDIFLEKNPVIL